MKKKHVILILISFVLSFQILKAQSNFKSGFIVNTKNETVYGYINDKVDYELIDNIEFKKELSDSITIFTPNDIINFQFEGGRRFERISKNNDSSYVFGKKHIQGKIDLFMVRKSKNEKTEFYLYNNELNRSVYLDPPKKKKIVKDGTEYITKTNNIFNGKLKVIKGESTNYKNIKYNSKLIINAIADYNKKFENSYPYKLFKEEILISYEVSLGTGWTLFPSEKGNFRVNISRNILNKEKNRTISYFSLINYTQTSEDINISGEALPSYVETSHKIRVVPFGIKFQTKAEKLIPYLYTGIGIGVFYVANRPEEEKNIGVFPLLSVGAGLKYKIGSNYIFTELTPQTSDGLFLNLGYSF